MSVFKHSKSPYYQIEFQLHGDTVRGSSKTTNKKEAEAIEQQWRAAKLTEIEQAKIAATGPMSLEYAFSRYFTEKGHGLSNAHTVWVDLERMLGFLGKGTLLSEVTDSHVMALVTWRRAHRKMGRLKDTNGDLMSLIAPATVNRSITALLKAVFTHAKRYWRLHLPLEPHWRGHFLEEPAERERELHDNEAAALDAAVREDYALWFAFINLTGLRHQETIIKWSEVNELAGTITTVGKGSRKVRVQITSAIQDILDQCRGDHPVWVFTYVCKRPDTPHAKAQGLVKGQRYPITVEGSKTQWRRLRGRSGVQDFRLHDFRHNVGTKVLRATGNLKLVQKLLNHADIKTTARYAHVMADDLELAMENFAKSRNKSRTALSEVS
jgi:integrase